MYTLPAYDGIERLESFGSKENSGTEAANVLNQMPDDMKLRLVEPTRRPACSAVKEIVNSAL